MRLILICSLLGLCLAAHEAKAQSTQPNCYLGLNLDKTLIANLNSTGYLPNRGFILEPFLKIKTKGESLLHLSLGYSAIGFDPSDESVNIENYQSSGLFSKLGIDVFLNSPDNWLRFSFTSLLTASLFEESWVVFFEGDYFPDYRETFKREGLVSVGTELGLNTWIHLGKNIFLHQSLAINIALHSRPQDSTNFPVVYIPGVGSALSSQGDFSRASAYNGNVKVSPTMSVNLIIGLGRDR